MLVVPMTEDFLDSVIETSRSCDYDGLVIVLARTADAETLHDGLIKTWPSLHDVTDSLFAVLCPDPARLVPGDAIVDNPDGPSVGSIDGFTLRYSSRREAARFAKSLWSRYKPTADGADHQAAWTEATNRCANYFAIPESHLPAILVLCLWQNVAVLILDPSELPLYRLIKHTMERLGEAPKSLREAINARDEFEHELRVSQESSDKAFSRQKSSELDLDESIRNLRGALEQLSGYVGSEELSGCIESSLIEGCREALQILSTTGDYSGALSNLELLKDRLQSVPDAQRPISRSVIKKFLRRLKQHQELLAEHVACVEEVRRRRQNLTDSERSVDIRRNDLGLADALIAEVNELVPNATCTVSCGDAGLNGWTVKTIGPATARQVTSDRYA
jgi:hypothetical protein